MDETEEINKCIAIVKDRIGMYVTSSFCNMNLWTKYNSLKLSITGKNSVETLENFNLTYPLQLLKTATRNAFSFSPSGASLIFQICPFGWSKTAVRDVRLD